MKILFFLHNYCYPPISGAYIRSYHLIKELSRNHDIYVISLAQSPVEEKNIEKMKAFCKDIRLVPLHIKNSFRQYFQSLLTGIPYKMVQLQIREADDAVKEMIEEHQIDILVLDYVFIASDFIKKLNIKKCLLSPNLEYILSRHYSRNGSLIRRFYGMTQWKKLRKYEFESFRHFDTTVFVSKNDETQVRDVDPSLSTGVVEDGIDTTYLTSQRKGSPSPPNLIYVGTMYYYPNIHAMETFTQQVLPLIRKRIPETKLTIVGEKPPGSIQCLKDTEGITVTGRVPDVRTFIDNATVYVVPLRIVSGVRYKILEALAMGIPVVSTSLGCEGLAVEHEKDILIADTPEDFSRQILRLIEDKELWKKISRSARELIVSRYRWDINAGVLEEILKKIVKKDPLPQ